MAEQLRNTPGITRGSDYHFHTKKARQSGQIQVSFPTENYPKQIGGIPFDVMPIEMTMAGQVVKQTQYATILKGYALVFITSYMTSEQELELYRVLETAQFQQ